MTSNKKPVVATSSYLNRPCRTLAAALAALKKVEVTRVPKPDKAAGAMPEWLPWWCLIGALGAELYQRGLRWAAFGREPMPAWQYLAFLIMWPVFLIIAVLGALGFKRKRGKK